MTVDQSSVITLAEHDPVCWQVKAGMTVIVSNPADHAWHMADVLEVNTLSREAKTPVLFQVADVETGVVSWISPERVTHLVP